MDRVIAKILFPSQSKRPFRSHFITLRGKVNLVNKMDYGQLFSNNNSEEKRLKIEGKKLRLTNIDTDLKAS